MAADIWPRLAWDRAARCSSLAPPFNQWMSGVGRVLNLNIGGEEEIDEFHTGLVVDEVGQRHTLLNIPSSNRFKQSRYKSKTW